MIFSLENIFFLRLILGNLDGPVSHEYNEPHALGGANRSNHVGGGGGSGTEEETCVRRSGAC